MPIGCSSSPTGSCSSPARRPVEQATGEHEALDFEGAFVRFLRERGH